MLFKIPSWRRSMGLSLAFADFVAPRFAAPFDGVEVRSARRAFFGLEGREVSKSLSGRDVRCLEFFRREIGLIKNDQTRLDESVTHQLASFSQEGPFLLRTNAHENRRFARIFGTRTSLWTDSP